MRIAISGHSGCGNTTVTRAVGHELDLDVVNYTFRNLAEDLGLSFEDIQEESLNDPLYDYLTDLMLIRAGSRENVVIGTRLAGWIFDADLRIWLEAPVEARAERIFAREGGSVGDVLAKTIVRDRENRQRYLELYGIDIDDRIGFDVTINTSRLNAEHVAGLAVAAATWAQHHETDGTSRHAQRIRAIISHELGLDETAFITSEPDIKTVYERARRT